MRQEHSSSLQHDGASLPDPFTIEVHITDENALRGLTPVSIRSYLTDHGWAQTQKTNVRPDVWELDPTDGYGVYSIIAPSDQTFVDYTRNVAEMLRNLSIVEERSELAIWREIALMSS